MSQNVHLNGLRRRTRSEASSQRGARRPRLFLLAGLALALAILLPDAAGALSTSRIISDPSIESSSARVAVAPDGTAIAAWIARPSGTVVEESTRPPGGTWSTPVALSREAQISPFGLTVAIDADHDAVIAWEGRPGSSGGSFTTEVQAVVSEAGASFGEPTTLSPGTPTGSAGSAAGPPSAAIDAAGEATVVWWPYNDAHPTVESASHPHGGPWQPMAYVEPSSTTPQNAEPQPQLVADADGDLALIWRNPLNETFYKGPGTARVALRSAGSSTWGTPIDISLPGDTIGSQMSIGIDGLGQATAVWDDETSGYVEASTVAPGGSPSTPVHVSEASTHALYSPTIAVDPAGDMTAVWVDPESSTSEVIQSSTSLAAGPWSPPVTISQPDRHVGSISLANADDGRAVLAWEETPEHVPYFATLRTISQDAEGIWGASSVLAAPLDEHEETEIYEHEEGGHEVREEEHFEVADTPGDPALALSPTGDLTAVWYAYDTETGENVIHALSEDRTPPVLSVEVPSSATVGQQVAMSATATDASQPVSIAWSFGDGSSATGASVTHAYASAGPETVTITATDAAGNSTSLTRTIAVSEAPPSGPAPSGGNPPSGNPPASGPSSPGGPSAPLGHVSSATQPPTAAQVISLPAAKGCMSRRTMKIDLHVPAGYTVHSVRVAITHKKTVTYTGRRVRVGISLVGLPLGRYTVTVTVTFSTGRKLTLVHHYLTCTPGKHKKKHAHKH